MRVLLIFLLALTIACSHQSEEEKLVKAMASPKSWATSLGFMAELWASNSVPSSLVRNSVESARKASDKSRKALDKSSAAEPLKRRLRYDLGTLETATSSLESAVTAGNRRAALGAVALYRRAYADFDACEKEYSQ